ncbi:hypothetical protein ACGFMK_28610 [Amycolatopsis sp. NPDC049252]|uniref:hypothetical protein n=1 Tax=Amycolatopsis sp. NPDC049252 TaxID=3363933 RepID=UPI003711BE14
MVLSGSDHWTLEDGTRHPTGYWAEEFVVPHNGFRTQGVEAVVATPGAVAPTVDQRSLDPEMAGGARRATAFRDYLDAIATDLARPTVLQHAVGHVAGYDAIYLPGGHGPMEDLAGFPPLGELLVRCFDTGDGPALGAARRGGRHPAHRPEPGVVPGGHRPDAE